MPPAKDAWRRILPRTPARQSRDWKSPKDAAEYAGVSVKTIRRRILDGSLPAHRFGPSLIRIDTADLDQQFRPVPVGGGDAA